MKTHDLDHTINENWQYRDHEKKIWGKTTPGHTIKHKVTVTSFRLQ